ncbi:MAG TPA: SDR family oxidoreductase [Acidimicrobiales bacterium]|nr:SDR family oxidoreductase [Acidimicrobiales bacterium]
MDRNELLGRFDLTDRVAIVTGGSRGIGRAVAEGFAAVGAKVVIASRKADACDRAVADIEAAGGTALAVPTHVGDLDQLAALVERTVEAFGGVDIVFNNAANALALPYGSITPEAWQKSFDANLRAPVFLVQQALPHLRKSDHAAVVNVITAGAFTQGGFMAIYVAAKTALLSVTRSMAHEFAGDGIRVNALAPGTTDTDMVRNTTPEMQKVMVAGQLIDRMARADEMAPAALFLASDAASFMTGHVLVVDGGLTVN